ncbi:carboxymuconolactone decarboxylase family protein [Mycolicibacterium holsaticum]|jgi:AhpD family alkylhydroperoxidase|uniref:carboxymuconolactone decarboxylase family protein n=1 Tax=Mycolicibacterium holsaticum TaxID=152142 RepID=UPI001C7D9DAB|nr:carboxymuconolactone decarboxylase family protein [Mycolicibacterium holsaticum]MDA4108280.1 4-carboxymuconolactone decarboxylase [Mycolicibacterium holsaticum DSM 44478 = JCM 12374]QZA12949.1 carboxymuconolactone decarboxylase family protein [Mycolicibacterium holsaticum DSM 44478 = JCM 12374]UNC09577.1 carboxymuconolactone decarboxylase family protein [Mycolicibacterium holsaticum DSM 44478 = JCM 12374]
MTTIEKVRRINLNQVSPEVYEAMIALNNAATKDLDPDLAELIKIRASQLNHCAFCLDMHTADARRRGISEQKITLLPAWAEAEGVYTEQEQAALALTEEITDLTHRHVADEVYARAAAAFSERELGQVIAMALTINAWNRIGVTTRLPVPKR